MTFSLSLTLPSLFLGFGLGLVGFFLVDGIIRWWRSP